MPEGFALCSQPDDGLSNAGANNILVILTLDAGGGLHDRCLVQLGHMLGHMRRRHRNSHAQCAEPDCRQWGGVPGDLDGDTV